MSRACHFFARSLLHRDANVSMNHQSVVTVYWCRRGRLNSGCSRAQDRISSRCSGVVMGTSPVRSERERPELRPLRAPALSRESGLAWEMYGPSASHRFPICSTCCAPAVAGRRRPSRPWTISLPSRSQRRGYESQCAAQDPTNPANGP